MTQVVGLVRKICPNMDMLVLYGEAGLQSVETNLYYCQVNDGETTASMAKMEIDFQTEKASLNKQTVFDLRSRPNRDK